LGGIIKVEIRLAWNAEATCPAKDRAARLVSLFPAISGRALNHEFGRIGNTDITDGTDKTAPRPLLSVPSVVQSQSGCGGKPRWFLLVSWLRLIPYGDSKRRRPRSDAKCNNWSAGRARRSEKLKRCARLDEGARDWNFSAVFPIARGRRQRGAIEKRSTRLRTESDEFGIAGQRTGGAVANAECE
jgi:hypothetical protein